MKRLSTGNPRLDSVLGGGFPRASINIVTGPPGSGKTLLASQIAFANATAERPALYITTLSEPTSKMVTYLQTLDFVEVDKVGGQVLYESLAEDLGEKPDQVAERIQSLILEHRPSVIIIDSFKAIADLMPDLRMWRQTVFELAGVLSAYDATSFWVGEYSVDALDQMSHVEFAVADGIVVLRRDQSGSRDDRFLHVAKLRGSAFRDGNHAFSLSSSGLTVYPRLISPPSEGIEPYPDRRVPSGIPELDTMMDGGLLLGSSTLVIGTSGSGKTIFGLQYLRAGALLGEPALLVNFQESPRHLARTLRSLGWPPGELLGPDRLDVFYVSPVELHIDSILDEVLQRVARNGVKRVVFDALDDLEKSARDRPRFHDYIYAFGQHFSASGVTTLLTMEDVDPITRTLTRGEISNMADNLIVLRILLEPHFRRTLRVVKTRGSAHDGNERVLRIGRGGMELE